MSRTAPAIASIFLALLLAVPVTLAQRPPRTAVDSLAAVVEPLFAAAKYDSILFLLPAHIRRAQASNDSVLLGRAITQRGRVALMQGRNADAENDIDLGIRIAEATRDTLGLMPAVHYRGFAYSARRDQDNAMRCYERRLLLAQRAREPVHEAWARSSMGYVYHLRSDDTRAREEYTLAIELFRANDFERLEITPLIGLGRVESNSGREQEAIRCYQRAWAVAKKYGDRVNEMWATNNLGALEGLRGDLSRCAQYQQRAYDLARELKYPAGMVVPAMNMADRAVEMGDFQAAENILREMRTLCETQGAEDYIDGVDFRLANLEYERGRYHAAVAQFRRLIVRWDTNDPTYREYVALNLANVLAAQDSVSSAIELVEQRIMDKQAAADRDVMIPANMLLARLYLATNDPARALSYALRARASAHYAGRTRSLISAMLRESVCRRRLGEFEAAANTLHAALDSLEAFRGGISTPEWREVYGQEVATEVVDAGSVLLEYPDSSSRAAREAAFFDAMQRVKTRTLLDRVTEPRFGTDDIVRRWSRRVATSDDVRAVLQPGELVLDFFLASDRAYLAAVTADSLRLVELPGSTSALEERIRLFRGIIASSDEALRKQYPVDRMRGMQRALGRDVLRGAADMVEASTRVFVAPDGFFASIPFGALIVSDDGGVLMAGRDIVQIPSTSVLVLERSIQRNVCVSDATLVAIASSEEGLPGARDEARDLARRYGDADHVANLAGVESFAQAAGGCDVLHVAAHALVVDRSPWESGIRLAASEGAIDDASRNGGRGGGSGILPAADSLLVARTFQSDPYLRAWQIAQLSLPAKLAVLSACETAGGRVTSGEGTLGITAAFLSAGVPVVVSSLWPIDDKVTGQLMRDFYRHLAARQPVATALRLAQLELAQSRDYSHPFFWAGFTVVGDGSMVVEIDEHRTGPDRFWIAALGLAVLLVSTLVIRRRRAPAPVG